MEPITVVVSGAAGQIGYSLLPLIANGRVFGDRKVNLRLLDINMGTVPQVLGGVKMELEDGAYPTLLSIEVCVADLQKAFTNADVAILTGGFPRKQGMERKDLISKNAAIFGEQGAAIEQYASKNIKVLVVANPANTNCLILRNAAPSVPAQNFTALTYLDHNRGKGQLAIRLGTTVDNVKRFCIWGNHSSTQVPDPNNGTVTIDGVERSIVEAIGDDNWLNTDFVKMIQTRGAAVINARKLSSAMSAANAIAGHIRTWLVTGTEAGDFTSLAVCSDGSYGVAKDLVFSFPVTCKGDGSYEIVQGLNITPQVQERIKATEAELLQEKKDADEILSAK